MRIKLLLTVLIAVGQLSAQPANPVPKPLTLFSVGGSQVSTDEFAYLYKKNHPKKEDYTEPKINEYLDLLIKFKLKVTEAISLGYDTTPAFIKEFKSYRSELKKPYLVGKDQLEQLTREAYERMAIEVRVLHILVSVKADAAPVDTLAAFNKANSLRDQILQGKDFAQMARESSDDAGGKVNGGDLGYFTVLQMVYPFEQAAYALNTGDISGPVRTRFGYHIIKVMDRRIARGEVEVSHIILRTGKGDEKKVKAKIFDIHTQLQGGRSWDELCKEFSDDQATRNSGGRLRPFGIGALATVPEFEAIAFSLHEPGEVSDPFQTSYGWHIIRLERRIPLPTYAQVEESLKRRVGRDERLQIADKRMFVEKRKAFEFTEQKQIKEQLVDLADTMLQKGRWAYIGDGALLDQMLFSLRAKEFKVSQFVTYVVNEQNLNTQLPQVYMNQLYDGFVKLSLEELEEDEIVRANPEYRSLVQEYKEGILLFTIMEKEVWDKASEDTTGLRAFYEKNKGKYEAGERLRARVFSTDDSLFLTVINKKVTSGDSITRQDFKKFKAVQGPRNFAPGESKAVDRVSKAIGVYTTRVEGTFYMVQIDNLVPPGVRTLEEVRSQVISDYQDYLEKKWISELRTKYPIRINTKGKKFVIRELIKP